VRGLAAKPPRLSSLSGGSGGASASPESALTTSQLPIRRVVGFPCGPVRHEPPIFRLGKKFDFFSDLLGKVEKSNRRESAFSLELKGAVSPRTY